MRASVGKRLAPLIFLAAFCFLHGLDRQRLAGSSGLVSLVQNWRGIKRVHASARSKSLEGDPRIAICLVGGARAFEITGPSIVEQILDVYGNDSDVFLQAPLDKNTYKLFLLGSRAKDASSARLASARIFEQKLIPELEFRKKVLTSVGSLTGIQGLLQYFNLVEGCWDLITKHEQQRGFQYDWIVRTRLDGYWNAPIPPISSFDRGYYTVPYGSQYGGLNDRLGIGDRNSSHAALHRLQCLERLEEHGFENLNSEKAFKAQLQISNTSFQLRKFPFCVVSAKKYDWPPREWGVPVMTMSSKGPLNGAKCRPCRPKVAGDEARAIAEALNRGWSWSGPNEGVELCDATGDWDVDWQEIFDEMAGHDQGGQRERMRVAGLGSIEQCLERMEEFRRMWDKWEAPSAAAICKLKFVP